MVQSQDPFLPSILFPALLTPRCCRGRLPATLLDCLIWDQHRTGLKGFAKIRYQIKEILPKAENKVFYLKPARQGHKVHNQIRKFLIMTLNPAHSVPTQLPGPKNTYLPQQHGKETWALTALFALKLSTWCTESMGVSRAWRQRYCHTQHVGFWSRVPGFVQAPLHGEGRTAWGWHGSQGCCWVKKWVRRSTALVSHGSINFGTY